jgi:hypothetical protein
LIYQHGIELAYINQKKQGNPTNSGIDVDITREAGNFN